MRYFRMDVDLNCAKFGKYPLRNGDVVQDKQANFCTYYKDMLFNGIIMSFVSQNWLLIFIT